MNWELYSFVVRSKRRVQILKCLEKPKTPTQIAKEIKSSVSHVSRTLREFKKRKLVKCMTPEEKIGRIYTLTNTGKEILKRLR